MLRARLDDPPPPEEGTPRQQRGIAAARDERAEGDIPSSWSGGRHYHMQAGAGHASAVSCAKSQGVRTPGSASRPRDTQAAMGRLAKRISGFQRGAADIRSSARTAEGAVGLGAAGAGTGTVRCRGTESRRRRFGGCCVIIWRRCWCGARYPGSCQRYPQLSSCCLLSPFHHHCRRDIALSFPPSHRKLPDPLTSPSPRATPSRNPSSSRPRRSHHRPSLVLQPKTTPEPDLEPLLTVHPLNAAPEIPS